MRVEAGAKVLIQENLEINSIKKNAYKKIYLIKNQRIKILKIINKML